MLQLPIDPALSYVGIVVAVLFAVPLALRTGRRLFRLYHEEYHLLLDEIRSRRRPKPNRRQVERRSVPQSVTASQHRPPERAVPAVPPLLQEALLHGECVVFVGAGVLSAAGYPTVSALLEAVLERVRERSPNEDWDAVLSLIRSSRNDVAIDVLRARLGALEMTTIIQRVVAESEPAASSPTLRALSDVPFSGAVTTDWSGTVTRELEADTSRVITPWRVEDGVEALRERRHFILEATGDLRRGPGLLLTDDDMFQAVLVNREYARFLTTLLATRSLLFVGATMADIERFMKSADIREQARRHWALVPWEPEIEIQRERFASRYGIELLVYRADEGHQPPTTEFARSLAAAPVGRAPATRSSPAAVEPLEEVVLINIGPFDQLRVELGPRTVLLGDNGSGKSSVLRAIALALVGDLAPQEAANRMLKTTALRGEVLLRAGRNQYRTDLIRESADRVRVDSSGYAPVQTRPWLAIGFPPIRGVTTGNPKGPTPKSDVAPGVEDLSPLLSDAPDHRLDGLKQWVVNTAVRGEEDAGLLRRLDQFFEVLRDLTPGVDFEFAGIDRRTWEVRLNSPDGPLSFDLLSRGMTAVLGWIGVLLQRLHEVYADAAVAPEDERALVLVDEIDVHLHPEWQQRLLPLLDRHFPGLQLIATTHSPLLVGNTRSGEVQVLQRRGGTLEVSQPEGAFAGWRSDQILTSGAFQMRSSRDADTAVKHAEYRTLMARGRTPDNDERAHQLHKELEARMPSTQETPEAREAAALLRRWLREQLADRPPEERDRVINEAELYLKRLSSGARS